MSMPLRSPALGVAPVWTLLFGHPNRSPELDISGRTCLRAVKHGVLIGSSREEPDQDQDMLPCCPGCCGERGVRHMEARCIVLRLATQSYRTPRQPCRLREGETCIYRRCPRLRPSAGGCAEIRGARFCRLLARQLGEHSGTRQYLLIEQAMAPHYAPPPADQGHGITTRHRALCIRH